MFKGSLNLETLSPCPVSPCLNLALDMLSFMAGSYLKCFLVMMCIFKQREMFIYCQKGFSCSIVAIKVVLQAFVKNKNENNVLTETGFELGDIFGCFRDVV